MSLADEVLATHVPHYGTVDEPRPGSHCMGCYNKPWPCIEFRLALSLQASEQVVVAARKLTDEMLRADDERIFSRLFESVTDALAEYDKGGQGGQGGSEKMNLLNTGAFTLHSGQKTRFKIDCDALSDDDWDAIAELVVSQYEFSEVIGIPRGGDKLASRLAKHTTKNSDTVLIVDDVLTTGTSMIEMRKRLGFSEHTHYHVDDPEGYATRTCLGFTVFQRGESGLWWVESLFTLNDDFAPVYESRVRTIPATGVWEIEWECVCGRPNNYTSMCVVGQLISTCATCFSVPNIYEMIRHKRWDD